MAIRYDKKLNQEINKTIKNFNQKIARLEKSDRELILPTKITKKAQGNLKECLVLVLLISIKSEFFDNLGVIFKCIVQITHSIYRAI